MRWLWLSLLVLLLDQGTKHLAVEYLVMHRSVPVMPLLNLTLTYNPGAAFSFLGSAGGWQRWLFIGLGIVICVILGVWLTRVRASERWLPVSLALVIGGALGNLWDRVFIGKVVDFIDVYYQQWHWPAFNVADSAICIGAAMLIVSSFKEQQESPAG